MSRLKIFVSAYACEPGLGSEIGVGWHWVLEMSRRFELWVLTRESNRHTIEPWIAGHPEFAGIHFLYFDLPKWARFWKKGLRGVRTYYNIWQRLTDKIVKQTMADNDITVFHHLTYGNALWPVSKSGSKHTFIWGPIGGLETIPEDYTRHYDSKSRLIEKIRRLAVSHSVKSRSFKRRAAKASLILCKTEDTLNKLPDSARKNALLFTDVATDNTLISDNTANKADNILDCIVVGRLDAWRGFDLAILAVNEALKQNPDIRLTIIGKGKDRERLETIVRQLGLDNKIIFTGGVSAQKYTKLMQQADIVLNPSLKEGAVTVSFDAMAMGKPLIAIDTGGYTRYFKPDYSVVIARRDRENVIRELSEAIIKLSDRELRLKMGRNAQKSANLFTWAHHGEDICDTIQNVVEKTR